MDNKTYRIIICVLIITTVIFAVLFITKKNDCKCSNCNNNNNTATTSKPVLKALKNNFIITEVNNCSIMAYMTSDDKKTPYSISFCEMDGSADMHFTVGEEIWIKYSEVLETYPPQIKPLEYDIVKKD